MPGVRDGGTILGAPVQHLPDLLAQLVGYFQEITMDHAAGLTGVASVSPQLAIRSSRRSGVPTPAYGSAPSIR